MSPGWDDRERGADSFNDSDDVTDGGGGFCQIRGPPKSCSLSQLTVTLTKEAPIPHISWKGEARCCPSPLCLVKAHRILIFSL